MSEEAAHRRPTRRVRTSTSLGGNLSTLGGRRGRIVERARDLNRDRAREPSEHQRVVLNALRRRYEHVSVIAERIGWPVGRTRSALYGLNGKDLAEREGSGSGRWRCG